MNTTTRLNVYLCSILTPLASPLHGAKIRLHFRQDCHSCKQHAMQQADLVVQRMPLQPVSFQELHAVLELPPRQRIGLDGLAVLKHLQRDDAQQMCIFTACKLKTGRRTPPLLLSALLDHTSDYARASTLFFSHQCQVQSRQMLANADMSTMSGAAAAATGAALGY